MFLAVFVYNRAGIQRITGYNYGFCTCSLVAAVAAVVTEMVAGLATCVADVTILVPYIIVIT